MEITVVRVYDYSEAPVTETFFIGIYGCGEYLHEWSKVSKFYSFLSLFGIT